MVVDLRLRAVAQGLQRAGVIDVGVGRGVDGDLPAEPSTLKDAKAAASTAGIKPPPPIAPTVGETGNGAPATTDARAPATASTQDSTEASRADLAKSLAVNIERAAAIRDRLVDPGERKIEAEKPEASPASDAKPDGGTA